MAKGKQPRAEFHSAIIITIVLILGMIGLGLFAITNLLEPQSVISFHWHDELGISKDDYRYFWATLNYKGIYIKEADEQVWATEYLNAIPKCERQAFFEIQKEYATFIKEALSALSETVDYRMQEWEIYVNK